MCTEGQNPRFRIYYSTERALLAQGLWPYSYYAATMIQLADGTGPQRRLSANRYPVRLDTGASMSVIPQRWLPLLTGFVKLTSTPVSFGTAGGSGRGFMAPGAQLVFPDDPCREYTVDLLVTPGLNRRNYGLLSLRDVVRYFSIETAGSHQLGPTGEPLSLPTLELIPR